MTFSVPTNWQTDLLDIFNFPQIDDVYGKLAQDFIGGGRPTYCLPHISRRGTAKYIKEIHRCNCKFNYLLNASCLNGQEFTRRGQRKIAQLLNWLSDIGVDSVTVSLPYLAEIIKQKYPLLKVQVSTMAQVDSVEKARFWESLGVDGITLSHTKVNRDFELLKQIRKSVKCKLQLLANNHCLYDCAMKEYHELFSSQASRPANSSGNFIFDYCSLTCRYKKIYDISLLISAPWIRPEDVYLYENIGIDSIKLVDRRLPTYALISIIKAYLDKKYEGNLVDLFPGLWGRVPSAPYNIFSRIRYFFRPFSVNIFMVEKLRKLLKDMPIYIDNKKLDGFIDFFFTHNCRLTSCKECGYCKGIAEKAVRTDKAKLEDTCKKYKSFLDALISGSAYRYF